MSEEPLLPARAKKKGRHNKYEIKAADFKLFTVLWNQAQGRETPLHHFTMMDWLERAWEKKQTRLLMMAFRSSGKSTIVGLFAAWVLYRNQDLRILVLAADYTLAKKMVRNVKRIFERHPLTKKLLPTKPDQWAGDRFTLKRMVELRDPSMVAKGISSNITGSRADLIICDDVEVPNTCDTAEKREDLRERLAELSYVLVPGGTQLYVGTPHSYFSIYADEPRKETGEDTAFLDGFKRFMMPVVDEQGESAWPDHFNAATIEHIKRQTGPNKFASQMMLKPVNITEGRLDSSLLKIYEDPLDYTKEIQTLFLGQKKMVSASAWWDPAFGSASGDKSVVAVIYTDETGRLYLHHMRYIQISDALEQDEATQQCQVVAQIAKDHYLPSITVEINGIGKFLPAILRNEMAKAKTPCRVQEFANRRPKDVRILEAFDAVLAAQRLHIHESVLQTPFMTEMREWRPGSSKGYDDGLDAVAGALSLKPFKIERVYGRGCYGWMDTGRRMRAKTCLDD